MKASLLVELFTEELPPKALRHLGEAFGHGLQDCLIRAQLKDRDPRDTRIFATTRRLAVLIKDVRSKAADRTETKKLMPSKVAFGADGEPSAALVKRLEKEGATADQIERKIESGGEYAFLTQTIPGTTLNVGLQIALQESLAGLPIPKVMSYQLADGATTVQFVRPVHGLVALHGKEIVPVSILGLDAGRITHGHRFQGVKDVPVGDADAYEEALAAHGRVIASFDTRRAEAERQLRAEAKVLGASLGPEDDVAPLLDEVTALVEFPSVYAGEFEREFLAVPQECLVLTMRTNQKYFPLFDPAGKLTNRFLIVSNMRLADPRNIVEGNNRVVRPRLADARFFFATDKKSRLEARVPRLGAIVYHNKLGSQLERVERVQLLAGRIAREIGADAVLAERAAWLAKADLVTNMVGEFPQLQGIMGRYYALADGESPVVADAVEQHYRPRFAGDAIPANGIGVAVALADKLEALVGIFGIGQQPTGDKDPFALRRHALGILRILIELNLPVDLTDLIKFAEQCFSDGLLASSPRKGTIVTVPVHAEVVGFVKERAKSYLRDLGYSALEVESVLAMESPFDYTLTPAHLIGRLEAVRSFLALPEAAGLAEADKRIRNIITKSGEAGTLGTNIDEAAFESDVEGVLHRVTENLLMQVDSLIADGNFKAALLLTAGIHAPVAAFFDKVMINAEKPSVRENRFALLRRVVQLTNRVANISKLAV